jgi:hypothetical protein
MPAEISERALWGIFYRYLIFLLITLLLHIFGPWGYVNEDVLTLFLFMALFVWMVFLGFRSGLKSPISPGPANVIARRMLFRLFGLFLLAAFCLKGSILVSNALSFGGGSPLDSVSKDLGQVYIEAHTRAKEMTDTSVLVRVETLFGFCWQMALIGGFYCYSRMKGLLRGLFLSLLAVIFINTVAFRGTQTIVGTILIYGLSVGMVLAVKRGVRLFNKKLLLLIILVVVLFANMQASRMAAYGVSAENFPLNSLIYIKKDHWFFTVFGNNLGFIFAIMVQYLSMGYYGLSMCLKLDFVWTYGLGSSMALSSYANQYLGVPEQLQNAYPLRLEGMNGWPALMYWQSVFPWLAGDLTWLGTLLLFAFLGYLYAVSLREAICYDNLLSMMLVANLNVMWLFVPANNQLMQTRESTLGFLSLMLLWLCFHQRFNRPSSEA